MKTQKVLIKKMISFIIEKDEVSAKAVLHSYLSLKMNQTIKENDEDFDFGDGEEDENDFDRFGDIESDDGDGIYLLPHDSKMLIYNNEYDEGNLDPKVKAFVKANKDITLISAYNNITEDDFHLLVNKPKSQIKIIKKGIGLDATGQMGDGKDSVDKLFIKYGSKIVALSGASKEDVIQFILSWYHPNHVYKLDTPRGIVVMIAEEQY